MSCEQFDEQLNDYVDGARAADVPVDNRRRAFEAHLAGCPRCQALVADFGSIRRTTATLEEHVPPPRVWAKIASSVEEDGRRFRFAAWMPAAVAASLVLLIAGAWLSWTPRESAGPEPQAAAPAEPIGPAEQPYEQAIAGLQQLADSQDAALDPDTRAVLKENLAVIDRAIIESRAALASDPASALAEESLLEALDTKVALLQDTVALASDDVDAADAAAGAAKGLNQ